MRITSIQLKNHPAHQAHQVGAPPGLVQKGGLEDQDGQQEGGQTQQLITDTERFAAEAAHEKQQQRHHTPSNIHWTREMSQRF